VQSDQPACNATAVLKCDFRTNFAFWSSKNETTARGLDQLRIVIWTVSCLLCVCVCVCVSILSGDDVIHDTLLQKRPKFLMCTLPRDRQETYALQKRPRKETYTLPKRPRRNRSQQLKCRKPVKNFWSQSPNSVL